MYPGVLLLEYTDSELPAPSCRRFLQWSGLVIATTAGRRWDREPVEKLAWAMHDCRDAGDCLASLRSQWRRL